MGLFSKKNESENTISKEILDAIHISTLDYVPGYKVVKAFGMVGGWSWSDNPINDCIDNLKEKALKQRLIDGVEMAKMSQFLATIKRDVDINFDINKTSLVLPDVNRVADFLKKVQLFSFLKNLDEILSPFEYSEEVTKEIKELASDPMKPAVQKQE